MGATVAITSEALEAPHDEMAYAQAMGRLIEERFAMMMSYRDGTIEGSDPEDLHQMRVWSRRLRAAMDVSAGCFPRRYKFFHQHVKQLTDVLGDVRDSDVMIEVLSAYRDSRPADERPAIADMIRELRQRREAARVGMLTFFKQLERERFDVRFQGFIAERTHG
jgi:CHAD domain-containing protein